MHELIALHHVILKFFYSKCFSTHLPPFVEIGVKNGEICMVDLSIVKKYFSYHISLSVHSLD